MSKDLSEMRKVDTFYAEMWQDYLAHTPSAEKIHALLAGESGAELVNDHIALRTFNTPELGLAALTPLLLELGYTHGGDYLFEAKKLRAHHYEHSDPTVPKVFISELLLEECSPELNAMISGLLESVDVSKTARADFLYSGRHWDVSYETYQALLAESEYAAWVAAFGFRANHFTVSVNHLAGFDTVADVNALLQYQEFVLNTSGGAIKGSPEVLLEQSSTMADRVAVPFSDGVETIPACFYEFALRYAQADGDLYQGFVAASADKIFESTNNAAAAV